MVYIYIYIIFEQTPKIRASGSVLKTAAIPNLFMRKFATNTIDYTNNNASSDNY